MGSFLKKSVWMLFASAVFILVLCGLIALSLVFSGLIGLTIVMSGSPESLNWLQKPWHDYIAFFRARLGQTSEIIDEVTGSRLFNKQLSTIIAALHGTVENFFDIPHALYRLPGPWGFVFKAELDVWYLSWMMWPMKKIGGVLFLSRENRELAKKALGSVQVRLGSFLIFIDGHKARESSFHAALRVISKLVQKDLLDRQTLVYWDLLLHTPRVEGLLALINANLNSNHVFMFATFRSPRKKSNMFLDLWRMTTEPFHVVTWMIPYDPRDLGWSADQSFDKECFGAQLIMFVLQTAFPRLKRAGVETAYEMGYRAPPDIVKAYPDLFDETGLPRA